MIPFFLHIELIKRRGDFTWLQNALFAYLSFDEVAIPPKHITPQK
jgi:hypothetical protein